MFCRSKRNAAAIREPRQQSSVSPQYPPDGRRTPAGSAAGRARGPGSNNEYLAQDNSLVWMQEAFQREREGFQREREGFQRERTALENAAAEARARAETEREGFQRE
eukprot:CAMPEP_0176462322 /NCGR_PEP_ID=MMETSP0127-20121128/35191_1 /TAXON_ID=938130 /ORGANISM="Platyophrya macrostoma, Strain WH" /LENGTH=106 /DNA_ID=CAMNT_0017854203 /DNA_START=127 /DNA_END=444 /DNA_ORIENTATION=+